MRTSNNDCKNDKIVNGYDYKNQAWVVDGKYVKCGHPAEMNCKCFGKLHEGEDVE